MPQISETSVLHACRVLFGSELHLERDFLFYLQPGGLKTAFRSRAKETHPDRFGHCEPHLQQQKTRAFQNVKRAYEVVDSFLKQREKGLWTPAESVFSRTWEEASSPSARSWSKRETSPTPSPGELPPRIFKFGSYLLSRGVISYRTLILALVWQRAQRPSIGEVARRWGWLSEESIRRVNRLRGPYRRFGERAVALGLLSTFQVRTLLWYQRGQQQKLGQYFVEQGLLTPAEVEQLVSQMKEHNARTLRGPLG